MGTYEAPDRNIDKSFQAANTNISNFNKQLTGIYDSLNKGYQARKEQMRKLREKDMERYEKEYSPKVSDTPDTPYDYLDASVNKMLRDGGDMWQGSLNNQRLDPSDENYMSYKDAADQRSTLSSMPEKVKGVVNAMSVYGEDYRKALEIMPGKPGSVLNSGSQNADHITILDDLLNTGGKYITPIFDEKTGDVTWNYDNGETSFSLNSTEILRGAEEGNSFFETTGDIKGMLTPIVDQLKVDAGYDSPLKLTKDGKYTKTNTVQYSGEGGANDRLNFQAEKTTMWDATLESHKMKNIWGELKDNAFDIEGTIKIGDEEMTGKEAFEYFDGKDWIGAGGISLGENGTPSPEALEQRQFAKQMFVSYMNKPGSGFMKQDVQIGITEKYVAPDTSRIDAVRAEDFAKKTIEDKKVFIRNNITTGTGLEDLLGSMAGGDFTIKESEEEKDIIEGAGEEVTTEMYPGREVKSIQEKYRPELYLDGEAQGIYPEIRTNEDGTLKEVEKDEAGEPIPGTGPYNWGTDENVAAILDRYLKEDYYKARKNEDPAGLGL